MKTYQILVAKHFPTKARLVEVLQKSTNLNQEILCEATNKGAVWLQKKGQGKILRIRSPDSFVSPEDKLTFYYDSRVLSYPELSFAQSVLESNQYGVWLKDAGVMPQGTQTGDHTSLLRYVEKLKKSEVYLIHRLDRETEGLMIIGYTPEAARKLSELFQKNKIKKTYQAIVKGELQIGFKQSIQDSLDGKEALTHFEVLDCKEGESLLTIEIETGRMHQIRRHLEGIGYPIMGDPKYGKGNKNREGLKLIAKSLEFIDPWTLKDINVSLDRTISL
jgi:tRNA pseudouridine32 synthase/23S rRNA pseudouridine746 synthase